MVRRGTCVSRAVMSADSSRSSARALNHFEHRERWQHHSFQDNKLIFRTTTLDSSLSSKMSLKYGLGGVTTSLAVVGACKGWTLRLTYLADSYQTCSSLVTEKLSTYATNRISHRIHADATL